MPMSAPRYLLPTRVLAACVFALLVACQPSGASVPARPGPGLAPTIGPVPNTVSLSIGEELLIAGDTQLRLLRVVNDSRCPSDVQCVWAGEVTLEFELSTPSGKSRFQLAKTTKPRASAKGVDFELTSFGACPPGQGRMADAECAAVAISTPATS